MGNFRVKDIMDCNQTLNKLLNQRILLPVSVGLKVQKLMKLFDEIEEYVFDTMESAFSGFDWNNLNEKQLTFYSYLVSQEIELDFDKLPRDFFENNDSVMLTIEDVERLTIVLSEKKDN